MIITNQDLSTLPDDLPVPVDDGASTHLVGLSVPPVRLMSTQGQDVYLAQISQSKRAVVYCYPRTGRPGQELPAGWADIPGARGCTPQSCSFRDRHQELLALNAVVFGLSTQTTEFQEEAVSRLHLPFPLLSDSQYAFSNALNLPMFEVEGHTLTKRLTMIIWQGEIIKVFYPVFPPDKNAQEVIAWLTDNP
jgi:peroxiredoxin